MCNVSHTSCGGTSKETVRRSTFTKLSMHGMIKNKPKKNNDIDYVSQSFYVLLQPFRIINKFHIRPGFIG